MTSQDFDQFLASVELARYRGQYRAIKTVEMDLPKNIQAIATLYDIYWERQELISFERFYGEYYDKYAALLQAFQEKVQLCVPCFNRGLPARIYRTWASIVTQIHAGYVAQDVFGQNTVEMSAELDYKGVDFRAAYNSQVVDFQIKKESQRAEAKILRNGGRSDGSIVNLFYTVPSSDVFDNPRKRSGEYKIAYQRFVENPRLKRYDNGFIVFTPAAFKEAKARIDNETE